MQSHSHQVLRRRSRTQADFLRPSDTGELPRGQAWAGSSARSPPLLLLSLWRLEQAWSRACLHLEVGVVVMAVVLVLVCVLSKWAYQDDEECRPAFSMGTGQQALRNGDPENVGDVEDAVTTLLRRR